MTLVFGLSALVAPALQAGDKFLANKIGYTPLTVPNACLPDSIGFRNALEVYSANKRSIPWTRLLLVYQRDGAAVRAHAYCVYVAESKVWTYDQVAGS